MHSVDSEYDLLSSLTKEAVPPEFQKGVIL